MTVLPRDRVIAQINHQETDTIPYTIEFQGDVADRLDAHYEGKAWRDLIDNAIKSISVPSLSVDKTADKYYTDLYGSTWRVDRRPFHLVEPALKTPALEGYEFFDVDTILDSAWKEEALKSIEEQEDHFLVARFSFGLFERSWAMRGFEEALIDAAAHPDFFEELVEAIAKHQTQIIERLLELPVDGIMFGDDWGYQRGILLGAERWRRFLKPHLAQMYARVHKAGKYVLSHCCGGIVEIMPDLIEIGLDVYESVQPEATNNSPYELKRLFGSEITFWGGLGSQSTIPFGTPDEIRAEVTKLCLEMGRGGGYILSPAKALQPETPTENAAAVVEAFLRQAGVSFS